MFGSVKDYSIRDWYNNVKKFTYPNFDLCMVDNSEDEKYHKKLFKHFSERKKNSNIGKLTVLHTPRVHHKSEMFMAFSANALRKHFLKNNYDYLLYLECDIFPPFDILERLLSYNRKAIGALYFTGRRDRSYPMVSKSFVTYNDKGEIEMSDYILSYLGGFFDMGDYAEPVDCINIGLGCYLLSREIVEKIEFRGKLNEAHHDSAFAEDLMANNLQNQYVPIMCRHENVTWDVQSKKVGN